MKYVFIGLTAMTAMLGAVNLEGRVGMGLGFSPDTYLEGAGAAIGIPIIDLAVTKLGLNPKISLEPLLQFSMTSIGNGTSVTQTTFKIQGLADYLVKGHSKTNLYGKFGLGLLFFSPGGGANSEVGFNLPFGVGLEHFLSDHFSVNLAALSGITFISNPPIAGAESYMNFKLGNDKPFAFYLLWYY